MFTTIFSIALTACVVAGAIGGVALFLREKTFNTPTACVVAGGLIGALFGWLCALCILFCIEAILLITGK